MLFTNRVMNFMMPGMMLIMNLLSVGIVWFGAHRIDAGTMQVGAMTAFITYSMMIVMAFLMLTMLSIMLPRAAVAAERIDEVIRTDSSVTDKACPEKLEEHNGQIRFSHVNFRYPGAEAEVLSDIDFVAEPGKTTAIIGSTGCGKSTFLKTLNRMNDLVENCKIDGNVLLDGKDIFKEMDEITLRHRVGMVFQQPNPFPMSIYDNVAYGPRIHGIKDKKILDKIVEESLKGAAIWDEVKDRLKTPALGLSGGQQQRVCIARTIAMKPDVILMDEPTSALDPISTSKIEDLISELKKDYTIIIVTHNMQQAARISDETGFFLNGELIEYNNTKDIFTVPSDKRTEDYITGRFG